MAADGAAARLDFAADDRCLENESGFGLKTTR